MSHMYMYVRTYPVSQGRYGDIDQVGTVCINSVITGSEYFYSQPTVFCIFDRSSTKYYRVRYHFSHLCS